MLGKRFQQRLEKVFSTALCITYMAAFTELKAVLEERISSCKLQKYEKEANETYAASSVTPFKAFCDVHYLEL
jgi:hypothetical protein